MSVKDIMIETLRANIADRVANICGTWDYKATLETPWGVKEEVDIALMDEYQKFFEENESLMVDDFKLNFLKYGMKERNGVVNLIYRYQIEL